MVGIAQPPCHQLSAREGRIRVCTDGLSPVEHASVCTHAVELRRRQPPVLDRHAFVRTCKQRPRRQSVNYFLGCFVFGGFGFLSFFGVIYEKTASNRSAI